jgi:hypothetical protein
MLEENKLKELILQLKINKKIKEMMNQMIFKFINYIYIQKIY